MMKSYADWKHYGRPWCIRIIRVYNESAVKRMNEYDWTGRKSECDQVVYNGLDLGPGECNRQQDCSDLAETCGWEPSRLG